MLWNKNGIMLYFKIKLPWLKKRETENKINAWTYMCIYIYFNFTATQENMNGEMLFISDINMMSKIDNITYTIPI